MIPFNLLMRLSLTSLVIILSAMIAAHAARGAHHEKSGASPAGKPGSTPPSRTGPAEIEGQVRNGTRNGPGPEGLTVRLIHLGEEGVRPLGVTKTDVDGRFRFSNVKVPKTGKAHILAITQYQGVPYFGMARADDKSNPLLIYEIGADPSKVVVDSHQILVRVEEGRLVFREALRLANSGNTTYVPNSGGTLAFDLPKGAELLQAPEGLNPNSVKMTRGKVVSSEPLPPGFRQINLIYTVREPPAQLPVEKRIQFPTKRFEVMTTEFGMRQPLSYDLDYDGVFGEDIGDRFHVASKGDLPPGKLIRLTISRDVQSSSVETAFLAIAAVVIVGLFLPSLIRRRRLAGAKSVEAGPKGGSGSAKSAPSPPKLRPEEDREALLEERSELLRSIAVLDDELDAGKIQESEHERNRSALKLRAVELTRKIGKP